MLILFILCKFLYHTLLVCLMGDGPEDFLIMWQRVRKEAKTCRKKIVTAVWEGWAFVLGLISLAGERSRFSISENQQRMERIWMLCLVSLKERTAHPQKLSDFLTRLEVSGHVRAPERLLFSGLNLIGHFPPSPRLASSHRPIQTGFKDCSLIEVIEAKRPRKGYELFQGSTTRGQAWLRKNSIYTTRGIAFSP